MPSIQTPLPSLLGCIQVVGRGTGRTSCTTQTVLIGANRLRLSGTGDPPWGAVAGRLARPRLIVIGPTLTGDGRLARPGPIVIGPTLTGDGRLARPRPIMVGLSCGPALSGGGRAACRARAHCGRAELRPGIVQRWSGGLPGQGRCGRPGCGPALPCGGRARRTNRTFGCRKLHQRHRNKPATAQILAFLRRVTILGDRTSRAVHHCCLPAREAALVYS